MLFAGCSHRYSTTEGSGKPKLKVALDRIEGDKRGQLTQVVISALVDQSPYWVYEPSQGLADYVVHLRITSCESHPLGFRYDSLNIYDSSQSNERGGVDFIDVPIDRLVQDEARAVLVLEGELIHNVTQEKVGKPFKVEGTCSYDYINSYAVFDAAFINRKGDLESVLDFSLGQLDGLDGARDASKQALYEDVARHFVQGFNQLYFQLEAVSVPQ